MKKRLAIQPDYQKIQIGEIDKVITQLKTGGTTEEAANKIKEKLIKSLKDGYLNLIYSQISDEILRNILPLLSVLNIKTLNLGNSKIGPEGAKAIAEALTKNTSLTELNLEDTNLGPEGAKAIAEALTKNTSITELNLENTNLGPERPGTSRSTKNKHIT